MRKLAVFTTILMVLGFGTISQVFASELKNNEEIDIQNRSNKLLSLNSTTLKLGMRGKDVLEMKLALNKIGFNIAKNPTNYYGTVTERVVKEFQKYYNLNATGVADSVTLKKINDVLKNSLKRNDNSQKVRKLKENLNTLDFPVTMNAPKNFGPATERAVKAFQKHYKLRPTGIADVKTLDKISTLLSGPFKRGDKSPKIRELKENLNMLGFSVTMNAPNNFGPATERAVKEFQAYYGLSSDGIAGNKTLSKIDELLKNSLWRGKNNSSVKALKENLTKLGFPVTMNAPKNFGPATERAVKAFQKHYKLRPTGVADVKTLDKISTLLSGPFRRGDKSPKIRELKKNLTTLGFSVTMNAPNNFGPATERAVKEFQAYYGLSSDGIAGNDTLSKINELLKVSLWRGKNNSSVKALKENLTTLGFPVTMNAPKNFGPATERAVKSFQSHYGLRATGVADPLTLNRMDKILKSPFRRGQKSQEIKRLKENLTRLGYKITMNAPTSYGPLTEKRVKEFQRDHRLPVSGIADEITLAKIDELIVELPEEPETPEKPDQPKENIYYTKYKHTFSEALNIQMSKAPQTDKYKNKPAYVSANYIDLGKGARITGDNVRLRKKPEFADNIKTTVNSGTSIEILEEVNGDKYEGSNKWYKIKYKGNTLYVHSSLAKRDAKFGIVTASTLNVRSEANTSSHIYGQLSKGAQVTILEDLGSWYRISYNTWRNARKSDVESYLNPDKNDRFQHLDLSSTVGVSASELNKVLKGRGILEGKGQAFIDGAKKHKVNEIYLISHALLETGRGTSELATGVEVGKDKKGKLVLVTDKNRKDLKDIKKTYNMFGIGAVDSKPLEGGATRAYNEGWFTPEDAIIGGAKFVGENYINHPKHKQNTLYKMRWNPANPGTHQYATDIGWAVKQISQIKSLYDSLKNPTLTFDIPVYK